MKSGTPVVWRHKGADGADQPDALRRNVCWLSGTRQGTLGATVDQADNISAGTQVVSRVEVWGMNNSLLHPCSTVGVKAHRDRPLAVKCGDLPWSEMNRWRQALHLHFERALPETTLPERPQI